MKRTQQVTPADMLEAKRAMVELGDSELGLSPAIGEQIMANTTQFGVVAVTEGQVYRTLAVFSSLNGRVYVHHLVGEPFLNELYEYWWHRPMQVFVNDKQHGELNLSGWNRALRVFAHRVVDHRAFKGGVFDRTVPRFSGYVYERGDV